MLGSLARKLRILGFDTVYERDCPDEDLISLSIQSGRILLTSDIILQQDAKRRGSKCVLITGENDRDRLVELSSKLGISKLPRSTDSRCSVCNGVLRRVDEKDEERLAMYKCANCGKLYWRGGHWSKLRELFDDVDFHLEKKKSEIV